MNFCLNRDRTWKPVIIKLRSHETYLGFSNASPKIVLHFIVIIFRSFIFSVTTAFNFSVRKPTLILTFQLEIPRSFCLSFKQFTKYGTRLGNAFLLRETFSRANNKRLEERDDPSSLSLGRSLKRTTNVLEKIKTVATWRNAR